MFYAISFKSRPLLPFLYICNICVDIVKCVCLAVSLLWYLAKTTRLRIAAAAVVGRSCDIPSPAIGPSSLPSDLSAPAGESGFLLSLLGLVLPAFQASRKQTVK